MADPVLAVRGLRKRFGGILALDGIDFEVAEKSIFGVIGPNGAGKTTLFNLVVGDLASDSGTIRLFGRDVSRLRADRRVHLGLSRTYQVITLFPKDTLAHNIVLALLGLSRSRFDPFSLLAKRGDLWERARAALDRVGLAKLADRPLSQTSYGEQRRLELAMALAQEPRVLLLDEPLAGLSREERRDVQDLLATIPREVTVVMIEHDLDVALSFAEKITVLHYGQVIVEGTRAEIVADPRVQEVYLGA
jgi:branched-chain amino acid transport system ATP-binding protein